jgi:probable addiction module antidote protein
MRSIELMARKRNYRAFRDVEEDYFRDNPEEIVPYIDEIFDEYAEDGNSSALLASLRVIARVKGITSLAEATGMTRQGVQHALSSKGNPRFDNVNSIMHALGYRLMPEPLDNTRRV